MKSKKMADIALLSAIILFIIATAVLMFISDSALKVLVKIIQLISSTAIIGGVADWYGVVSIYGKPLGIKWKTQIIISKRKELAEGISRFICDDVLSKENIIAKIETINLVGKIMNMLKVKDKKKEDPFNWLSEFLVEIIWESSKNIDKKEVLKDIDSTLVLVVKKISITTEIRNFLKILIEKKYHIALVNGAAPEIHKILLNKGLKEIIGKMLGRAIDNYCKDNVLREQFAAKMKEILIKKTMDTVSDILKKVESDDDNILKIKARELIEKFIAILEDQEVVKKYDEIIYNLIKDENTVENIYRKINKIKESRTKEELKNYVADIMESIINEVDNKRVGNIINKVVVEYVVKLVEEYHEQLGDMIENNLLAMNNRELVEFIREGTERELQMIRLNGMLFGILFGIVIIGVKLFFNIT